MDIKLGCTPYLEASELKVSSPFNASRATFALNSGLYFFLCIKPSGSFKFHLIRWSSFWGPPQTVSIEHASFINSPYDIIIRNSADLEVSNSSFSSFGINANSKAITVYYSSGDVLIDGCSFTGSGHYGIGVYSTNTGTNVVISDNSFDNCSYGIKCYSSNAYLTSNVIEDCYYYAIQSDYASNNAQYRGNEIDGNSSAYSIYLNSSSPYLMYNEILNSKVFINGGSPSFATTPGEGQNQRGYNTIYNASAPLIRVQNSASPYLGYSSGGGYNSIYYTDFPHIYATNYSGVYADYNYWGDEGPVYAADGTSWVLSRWPLSQNPNPLSKPLFTKANFNIPLLMKSDSDEKEIDYRAAIEAGFNSDYSNSKNNLLKIISSGDVSKFSILSIIMYDHFSQQEKVDENSLRDNNTIDLENNLLLEDLIKLKKTDLRRPIALGLKAQNAGLSRQYVELS